MKMKMEMTEDERAERRRLQNEATAEWRAANLGYAKEHYRANYVPLMLARAKARAKKKGIPFDLTANDIIIPTHCPVLGLELRIAEGKQGPGDCSPCLDRMHPAEGYVRGNVRVISGRANTLKRDGTPEELRKVADWVEDNQF